MKERPVNMREHEVIAILEGRKTQLRRVVFNKYTTNYYSIEERDDGTLWPWRETEDAQDYWYPCPYGQTGDRMWVRETFAIVPLTAYASSDGVQQTLRPDDPYDHDAAIYREGWTRSKAGIKWRPSIHMPRWASRITLEVTDVRVERLQDISITDAAAEGVVECNANLRGLDPCMEWCYAYEDLWTSIHGAGSWDANPWVWVVEFKRVYERGDTK